MYLFVFLIGFVWFSLLHLFLYFPAGRKFIQKKNSSSLFLLVILLSAIIIAGFLTKQVDDVMFGGAAGWHLRHGLDFYYIDAEHGQYPYFPFLIFYHALANWLSELIPILTYSFFLKLLLFTALVYISFQIKKTHKNNGRELQLLFLTSPITYAVVVFHGQTDVVLLAFFIAAATLFGMKNQLSMVKGSLLYGCSIATKTWSVVFLPYFIKTLGIGKQLFVLLAGIAVVLFLDVFIYTRLVHSSFSLVIPAVLKSGGPVGIWGISLLFSPFKELIRRYNLILFGSGYLILQVIILQQKRTLWHYCFLTILGIYLIIPNWGIQYLFWILPFIYLIENNLRKKEIYLFILLGSSYTLLNYITVAIRVWFIGDTFIHLWGLLLYFFCWYWFILSLRTKTYG